LEKQDALKRSAMRADMLMIPEAETSSLMSELQSRVSSNQELAAIFDSIQRDSIKTTIPCSSAMELKTNQRHVCSS
uniref:Uncharacterized protein n=1 Tax=Stegastes partitus TaxID=144197 RepID=A0A3B5AE32_9TELE